MNRYRHIIWDFNGTLLDDSGLCIEIINGLLTHYGRPALSRERYEATFTFPVRDYYRVAGFDFERIPFEEVGTRWFREYASRVAECPLQEGCAEVLAALSSAGITQSILSALQQETLDRLIDHHGLRQFFAETVGIDGHLAEGKLQKGQGCMNRIVLPPRDILFVGDTGHDVETARSMGVDCILVPGGHYSLPRLEACEVPILPSLRQVASYVSRGSDEGGSR